MDTQIAEHPTETVPTDAEEKAEFEKYYSRKGKPLEIDGVTFAVHPYLAAAEQVDVWKDDSEILNELINAVLEKAPRFCEWIADQWAAQKMQTRIHEADKLLQDYESLPDEARKLVLSYIETGRVPEGDKAAFTEFLRERGRAAPTNIDDPLTL